MDSLHPFEIVESTIETIHADPMTSHGVGRAPPSYVEALDRGALKGARLGILREPVGFASEPDSEDFAKISTVFDRAVCELRAAGATIIDPIVIPELKAREQLMTNMLKVMADHKLDAIVHKAVEHQPTLIRDGVNPPWVDQKGAPHLNTFLVFVPSVVVPAGFTADKLPAGITFFGRPYDAAAMIKFAYAYEQATHHRRAPVVTPELTAYPVMA